MRGLEKHCGWLVFCENLSGNVRMTEKYCATHNGKSRVCIQQATYFMHPLIHRCSHDLTVLCVKEIKTHGTRGLIKEASSNQGSAGPAARCTNKSNLQEVGPK